MNAARILVVDDELDLCDTIRLGLSLEGFEVDVAHSGYAALGAVRCNPPDLIVLDVMLPEKNGYEVSRMIKEDIDRGVYYRPIPIIILTARAVDSPEREEFVMTWSRADHHMYKPFDMKDLVREIRRLLATSAQNGVTSNSVTSAAGEPA
jgi:DNA-binding response OmpR family regulator